jgi:hypothetical protein
VRIVSCGCQGQPQDMQRLKTIKLCATRRPKGLCAWNWQSSQCADRRNSWRILNPCARLGLLPPGHLFLTWQSMKDCRLHVISMTIDFESTVFLFCSPFLFLSNVNTVYLSVCTCGSNLLTMTFTSSLCNTLYTSNVLKLLIFVQFYFLDSFLVRERW